MMAVPFADQVSNVCHQKYNSLPKRGKPIRSQSEWTLLSAILYTKDATSKPIAVAMGTGSKCIGKSKMSLTGNIINDSHAEVMTRRAFICYLLGEVMNIARGEESDVLHQCVESEEFRCEVKEGVQFHMYSSHTPCGDASIFPKQQDYNLGDIVKPPPSSRKRKLDSAYICCKKVKEVNDACTQNRFLEISADQQSLSSKQLSEFKCSEMEKSTILDSQNGSERLGYGPLLCVDKSQHNVVSLEDSNQTNCDKITTAPENLEKSERMVDRGDIYRTGAKCVPGGPQDPREIGSEYHCVGVLRIKPGRGDRTISMSCSDKLARWNVVGCQGALLSHFLKSPIYLKTLVIGRCPWDQSAMDRALVDRISMVTNLPSGYHVNKMECYQSSQSFCDGKEALENGANLLEGTKRGVQQSNQIAKPSPTALFWYLGNLEGVGVTVNGRKQGVTAKNIDKPGASCPICPLEIFKQFNRVLSAIEENRRPNSLRALDPNKSYWEFKSAEKNYQAGVERLKQVFSMWISKPRDHLKFTCNG